MANTPTSEKLTLKYPLFCAEFLTENLLVVAGGGGEGRSGIPNKISLLDVKDVPTTLTEIDLSRDEDAVMSLGISRVRDEGEEYNEKAPLESAVLFAGVNSSEAQVESGKNSHFRTFDLTVSPFPSITTRNSIQLFSQPKEQNEIYQRLLRISPSGLMVAIATGGGKQGHPDSSEIVLVNAHSQEVRSKITPDGGKEVEDLDIYSLANGSERLAYCTSSEVFAQDISTAGPGTPKSLYAVPTVGPKPSIRAIRFISSEIIAIIQNAHSRTGATLLILETTGKLLARKRLPKHIKAVTALDVTFISRPQSPPISLSEKPPTRLDHLPPIAQYAIALSAADMSLSTYLLNIDFTHGRASLQPYETFRSVHPFQITRVSFGPISNPAPPSSTPTSPTSPSSPRFPSSNQKPYLPLASTSMGNTVVVHKFPLLFVPSPSTDSAPDDDAEQTALNSYGAYYLRVPGVKRQTFVSVGLSLVLVIVLAIAMQVVFVRRGGLINLNDWSDSASPLSGGFSQFGGKGLEEKCDMGCANGAKVEDLVITDTVPLALVTPEAEENVPVVEDSVKVEEVKDEL